MELVEAVEGVGTETDVTVTEVLNHFDRLFSMTEGEFGNFNMFLEEELVLFEREAEEQMEEMSEFYSEVQESAFQIMESGRKHMLKVVSYGVH